MSQDTEPQLRWSWRTRLYRLARGRTFSQEQETKTFLPKWQNETAFLRKANFQSKGRRSCAAHAHPVFSRKWLDRDPAGASSDESRNGTRAPGVYGLVADDIFRGLIRWDV